MLSGNGYDASTCLSGGRLNRSLAMHEGLAQGWRSMQANASLADAVPPLHTAPKRGRVLNERHQKCRKSFETVAQRNAKLEREIDRVAGEEKIFENAA
jgi:hypothetical protein